MPRHETTLIDGLLEAVSHASVLFNSAHVSPEHDTNVDVRVNKGDSDTTGSSTRGNLGSAKRSELGLLIVFGEQLLRVVLEYQVECGSWDVPDAISLVSVPEGSGTEFRDVT